MNKNALILEISYKMKKAATSSECERAYEMPDGQVNAIYVHLCVCACVRACVYVGMYGSHHLL